MSKVLHSRLFRFLVCFLVVCCILVNLSPLNADATVVVGTALTLEGILALLFSMAMGVVAVDLTAETINRIGTDMEETIITEVDISELEKWNRLKSYWENIDPDGPEDPGEWHDMLKKALAGGLLTAITGWLCTLVNAGGYELEGGAAKTGFSVYNGRILPTIPIREDLPYIVLYATDEWANYWITYSDAPLYYDSVDLIYRPTTNCYTRYGTVAASALENWVVGYNSWKVYTDMSRYPGAACSYVGPYIWSNYDIYDYDYQSTLIHYGTEPSDKITEVVVPDIYVGDIPGKIQNGEIDEDDIKLPVLDPYKLIQSPDTALNDLNQMQQALKDGTITLDDYLKQVQVQDPTDNEDPSNPTQAPSESTNPTTAVDPWEPPENPGQFGLDLREVFPFCIPFDLYNFLSLLNAEPVAPVINWEIALPGGGSYPLRIDLSPFDSVAQLLRRLELLLFIIALGIKTRDLIKG